ncbi:MAG: hypothetical protein V3V41_07850 [Candidatus Heimdallarchaeota archaeon]
MSIDVVCGIHENSSIKSANDVVIKESLIETSQQILAQILNITVHRKGFLKQAISLGFNLGILSIVDGRMIINLEPEAIGIFYAKYWILQNEKIPLKPSTPNTRAVNIPFWQNKINELLPRITKTNMIVAGLDVL